MHSDNFFREINGYEKPSFNIEFLWLLFEMIIHEILTVKYVFLLLVFFEYITQVLCLEVIYAINAGGETFTDSFGIKYIRDPLMGKVGTASDYGKQLIIGRINPVDQTLYQTERYHHSTFGYDIPISEDGKYVMILKFCEVYFNSPNMKVGGKVSTLFFWMKNSFLIELRFFFLQVFDVVLNGDHTVVTDLDIFEKVGKGVAYNEYIPFAIQKGKLMYNNEESDILGGKIRVEFIKVN